MASGAPVQTYEFTPDQIVEGIEQAIHDGEVAVVPSLIKLLAVQDPRRAQQVLDTIEAGIAISRAGDPR
jgi:hypothetical protein